MTAYVNWVVCVCVSVCIADTCCNPAEWLLHCLALL